MIEFVGPLPPPVHGFAWVNQQVLDGLRRRFAVRVRDRALPRGVSSGLRKCGMPLAAFWQWFQFSLGLVFSRPRSVYLGCSGGAGMLVDCAFLLVARALRLPVYVHHHAFSYLNAPSRIARLCLGLMRRCQHIALCSHMAAMLCRVHAVPAENILVLSNAAFLPEAGLVEPKTGAEVVVGFLSNIAVEKGILDFFDLAERFASLADGPRFLIAGPVGEAVRDVFEARLAALPNVEHVGPVYGEAKDAFYRRLDLLAFPTRYANEAEPVTILEAFRAGVPVIANHRGCIASMIDESSGMGVVQASDFVEGASAFIARVERARDELAELKTGAQRRFVALQAEHSRKLAWMLDRIAEGLPVGGEP